MEILFIQSGSIIMTDIEKFDRAVYDYLLDISDKVVYAPTDMAIRTITKREQFSDKKPWNFLSYHRTSDFSIDWDRANNPGTIYGDVTRVQQEGSNEKARVARYTQNVPLDLTYVVNLWASKETEVLALGTRLFSKVFMDGPNQVLLVPLNPDGEDGRFHIVDVSWTDNSDLERETEIGRIYRHTIQFTVDARITLTTDVKTERFKDVPVDIYDY